MKYDERLCDGERIYNRLTRDGIKTYDRVVIDGNIGSAGTFLYLNNISHMECKVCSRMVDKLLMSYDKIEPVDKYMDSVENEILSVNILPDKDECQICLLGEFVRSPFFGSSRRNKWVTMKWDKELQDKINTHLFTQREQIEKLKREVMRLKGWPKSVPGTVERVLQHLTKEEQEREWAEARREKEEKKQKQIEEIKKYIEEETKKYESDKAIALRFKCHVDDIMKAKSELAKQEKDAE